MYSSQNLSFSLSLSLSESLMKEKVNEMTWLNYLKAVCTYVFELFDY
jgi:hypothetical protein